MDEWPVGEAAGLRLQVDVVCVLTGRSPRGCH